jgi:anti-anti-sigma regulatory factor
LANREEPSPEQVAVPRPDPAPRTAVIYVPGPIAPQGTPAPCEQVRSLVEDGDVDVVICDVGSIDDPDLATIDALAGLALTARRSGGAIHLRRASPRLQELIALAGLESVLPVVGELPLEARRQAEEREQLRRVEEVVDPDDAGC